MTDDVWCMMYGDNDKYDDGDNDVQCPMYSVWCMMYGVSCAV